jgi:hypothetical protein
MKNNERSSNKAIPTLRTFGWAILAVGLAGAIYTASPAEAKPTAQPLPSESQEAVDPEASAPTEFDPSSDDTQDFNDDYEMEHPSGGG